jgi:multidrug efflux pump subunit AcrB
MMNQANSGLIAWFARNPVAANLLMIFTLVVGWMVYATIQRQMFPGNEAGFIQIQAVLRGAAPQEIEEGILIRLEEALADLEGVKRQTSSATSGSGRFLLELEAGEDASVRLDQVKLKVDAIHNFPAAMEPLVITQRLDQQRAVELVLTGSNDELALKAMGAKVRDALLKTPNIQRVEFNNMPAFEVSIEIEPKTLQQYNISLQQVSHAIAQHSDNITAGNIRSSAGNINIRSEQRAYRVGDFSQIPVVVGAQGEQVLLGDIAVINDGFEERVHYMLFDGQPAALLSVIATAGQSLPDVAASVDKFIKTQNQTLPGDFKLHTLVDMTYYLDERLEMMLSNLLQGVLLVFALLVVFLRLRIAFWVVVGLPVSFLGAVMLMPLFDVSINIITLFGFIMVLGILVDDAIIISESAYTETAMHGHSVENVIRGVHKVATTATFGVLTTVAVFLPFMFAQGAEFSEFKTISIIVVLCLLFSLIESKWVLPAHLAASHFKPQPASHWRSRFQYWFEHNIRRGYLPALRFSGKHPYLTVLAFCAVLFGVVFLIASAQLRVVMAPPVPHDYPEIEFEMYQNSSQQQTLIVLQQIEQMVRSEEQQVIAQTGRPMIKHMMPFLRSDTSGSIMITLVDESERPLNAFELGNKWRQAMPELAGVRSIRVKDDLFANAQQRDLGFQLYGDDPVQLNQAGLALIAAMQQLPAVYDIGSTIDSGTKELNLQLKPVALQLGLTSTELARQVGHSFYGIEAQRMVRDGDEVRVMVRYPAALRQQLSALVYTRISLANGGFVMLGDVADIHEVPGVSSINREAGDRSVRIDASVNQQIMTTSAVVTQVKTELLPQILQQYPGVKSRLTGMIETQQRQMSTMGIYMVAALLLVYMLLAIPLRSYRQPLLILAVVPFGLAGGLWAHYAFGADVSLFSVFGLIAAAGVVVNDSLLLSDAINQLRRAGHSVQMAIEEAGCTRFRPIFLTSVTTFAGLVPLMFETSLQAQFVIPMAISLSFSVLFATVVTLFLVPALYLIAADISALQFRSGRFWPKQLRSRPDEAL